MDCLMGKIARTLEIKGSSGYCYDLQDRITLKNKYIYHFILMLFFAFVGLGTAIDIPYVFGDNFPDPSGLSSIQIEEISASTPQLTGIPVVSVQDYNETISYSEVGGGSSATNGTPSQVRDLNNVFNSRVEPENDDVRSLALILASNHPGERTIDQISGIYEYLKTGSDSEKGWKYVSDPRGDLFQYASFTLNVGKKAGCVGIGDCDDFAILMSALIEAIGGTTRVILAYNNSIGSGHAYTEVYLGDMDEQNNRVLDIINWIKKIYQINDVYTHIDTETKDVWLNLDWSANNPGGPFFKGDVHTVILIRDVFKKTKINLPIIDLQEETKPKQAIQTTSARTSTEMPEIGPSVDQKNQLLGPYSISFNIDANYELQPSQPIETESAKIYQMRLLTDNSTFAVIEITEYLEPNDATLQVHKSMVPMKMMLGKALNATTIEDKTIDGKEGFIVTSVPFEANVEAPSRVYRAMYWLDSQYCECGPVSIGKISVIITSTYPQHLTEDLLSSLHVEKYQATPADAKSYQYMPSANKIQTSSTQSSTDTYKNGLYMVPDSQQLGPYLISFGMNANYQAQIAQPIETETANAYQMRLFIDNSTFAVIGITEYAQPTDATLQVHKSLMAMNMMIREGLNATNVEDRTIDGMEGFMVTSAPFEAIAGAPGIVYRAMYWLDSQDCECGPVSVGKTSVVITSTYPLDVTESLLSSLQIVKGEAAAPDQGSQVLPPT